MCAEEVCILAGVTGRFLWHRSSRLASSERPSWPLDPSALRSQMFVLSLPLGAPDFLHMSSEYAERSGNCLGEARPAEGFYAQRCH